MRWNKVEKLLQQRQKTIYWLSKQTGISVSSLYYLRDGKLKKPSFDLMCKIADALNVSLDYFRETEDNK